MIYHFKNARLEALIRQYPHDPWLRDDKLMHWVYLPAILFAVLGMLFILNLGIALIAVAVAILYYSRYGQGVAAQLGAVLLAMLGAWMMLMPVHHLAAASLGIFLFALAGRFFGQRRARGVRPIPGWKQYLLAGPVLALAMFREKLAVREALAERSGLDAN